MKQIRAIVRMVELSLQNGSANPAELEESIRLAQNEEVTTSEYLDCRLLLQAGIVPDGWKDEGGDEQC